MLQRFVLRGGLSPARSLWQGVFCALLAQRHLPGRVLRGISSEVDLLGIQKIPGSEEPGIGGAPEGIRTPNLLIRSQMLYPLSYRRMFLASDFFNPSRQQVLLYGCPRGRASRKTRNLPKIPSERLDNALLCRMISGFLVSENFFKIFLFRPELCPETYLKDAQNIRLDPAESPPKSSKKSSRPKNVMRKT